MKYRIAGVVLGVGLAAALFYGLEPVLPLHYTVAAAVGAGTGVFLVVDGSAGAGEGWIYHRVRSTGDRVQDGSRTAGAGVLAGVSLAMLADAIALGDFGGAVLAGVGALLGANFAYLYFRPDYEQQLAEMEE